MPDDALSRKSLEAENTYARAVVDRVKELAGGGAAGAAAKELKNRKSKLDAAIDSTQDPTHVHFGGNPGSSTGQ